MDWTPLPKPQSTSSLWSSTLPTAQPISTSIAGFGSAGPANPFYNDTQYAPGSISNDSRIAGGHMSATGANGTPNFGDGKTDWGGRFGMMGNVAQSLAGLFSVIQGFKQTKLAGKSLNFQKDAWTKQYNMSKEDHDRELADRAKNRKQVEDQTLSA